MKIDALSGYPVIRKTKGSTPAEAAASAKTSSTESERAGKTDVVEFSRGQTATPDKHLVSLKSSILGEISQPAPAQELAALKDSIREGAYRRSTDELVDAILGRR